MYPQYLIMLETLITSRTRLRLLLKFFLNSNTTSYLRDLEGEFGESTNAIRLELNRFEDAGLLTSEVASNRKYYRANTRHPLFPDINNILRKYIGLDRIVEEVITKLGNLDCVFVAGSFARGTDSNLIELIFVGSDIDRSFLARLVEKAENLINRKISYSLFTKTEFNLFRNDRTAKSLLLLWEA